MKQFLKKNWSNIILVGFLLLLLFVPDFKSFLLRGIMAMGFLKPETETINRQSIEPDVIVKDVNGTTFPLSSLSGKVLFVNIWATWCPPCRAEMPAIIELEKKFRDNSNIRFLMIDADGDLSRSGQFMEKRNYKLPLYAPVSGLSQPLYSGTLPTTFIVDKRGKLAFREEGVANYNTESFENFLKDLALE